MKIPSKRLPTTINGAKEYAKKLRISFMESDTPLSHAQALERTANELGYRDWNTARTRLSNRPKFEPQIGDLIEGVYLKQKFKGLIKSVRMLADGQYFDVSIQFEKAVDVVSFESFSAYRQRVSAKLDNEGTSLSATSDGEPHMIIHHTHSKVI
ncbi:glyoxalase superfamily protein [Hirschia maritima]|uniref:glyoxalase superfamily protein n=1 Tax=Hirschia maritima TaxID=1121961 RepID=UPI000371FAA9|nr:glyoxalase superfamily protein [Hirschia maritima]